MDAFARVVVGVDGTDWGFEALRQTLALAPTSGSVGHIVTVLDSGPAARLGFDADYWVGMLEAEAAEAKEQAVRMLGGRPWDARIVAGKPLHVLRRTRDEEQATLVAIGARHSSRFLGVLLGDTASELVHDGACSMLLARPREQSTWKPERIVVGLDGSAPALAALETADDLVQRLGSGLKVFSSTRGLSAPPEGEWTDRVDSWDEADAAPALVERSERADLVVVGSRGLHGVRALGSVSEQVAHHARCSVLIVHTAP